MFNFSFPTLNNLFNGVHLIIFPLFQKSIFLFLIQERNFQPPQGVFKALIGVGGIPLPPNGGQSLYQGHILFNHKITSNNCNGS